METWSRALKIASKVLGVFIVLFGILIAIGFSPHGETSIPARIIFLLASIFWAIIYWIPNEILARYKKIYLAFSIWPAICLCAAIITIIVSEGVDSILNPGAIIAGVMLILFLSGPASLILHLKSK